MTVIEIFENDLGFRRGQRNCLKPLRYCASIYQTLYVRKHPQYSSLNTEMHAAAH